MKKHFHVHITTSDIICHSKDECLDKIKQFQISKRSQSFTIVELAQWIQDGHIIVPYSTDKYSMSIRQNVFALDIDNKNNNVPVSDMIDFLEYIGIYPAIIYTTFSSTEENERYRLIFILTTEFTNIQDYQHTISFIAYKINQCFPGSVDMNAISPNHAFFPGKEILYVQPESFVSKRTICQLIQYYIDDMVPTLSDCLFFVELKKIILRNKSNFYQFSNTKKYHQPALQCGSYDIEKELSNVDPIYIRQDTNDVLSRVGLDFLDKSVEKRDNHAGLQVFENIKSGKYMDEIIKKYVGIRGAKSFNCILPGHNDTHPSASISIDKSGKQIYNCFGCDSHYDLIGLTQEMFNQAIKHSDFHIKYIDVLIWFKGILGLTESISNVNRTNALNYLLQLTEPFSSYIRDDFPLLYKKIFKNSHTDKYLLVLRYIISFALKYSSYVSHSSCKYLFAQITYQRLLTELCDISRKAYDLKSIKITVKELIELGLLINMPDEDIPPVRRHILITSACKQHHIHRGNVYGIPLFDRSLLQKAEERLKLHKRYGMTIAGRSKRQLRDIDSPEEIDHKYVQETRREPNTKYDSLCNKIIDYVKTRLYKHGFVSRRAVSDKFNTGFSKKSWNTISSELYPGIVKILNIHIVKYNKSVKEKLDLKYNKYNTNEIMWVSDKIYKDRFQL